nr:AEC family transporter [Clostridia bacterium]
METLLIMLKNVIIFVLLAVPGYLLVRGNMLTQKESGTLSKLLTNVGMPFLILSSTLKLEFSGEFTVSMIVIGLIGVLFTILMFICSELFVKGETDPKRKNMMRFCSVFANNGFIGIPLARAVFGEASSVMAYLIILNIITNVLMFTLGVYLISGDKSKINVKKAVLNPVLISFIIGVVLNLIGIPKFIPEVQTYATYFSNIVTPLSMVILGMKLAGVKFSKLFTSARMYYVSAIRLIIYPAVTVGIMFALSFIPVLPVGADAVTAMFVALAMPTAGLASAFSDQYDGDTEHAVIFTLGTTILSVVTIPAL